MDWVARLHKNHDKSKGIWLRIAKKGAAVNSISYAGALEAALAYGWSDAQKRIYAAESRLQKFTRGPRSV